MGELRIDGSKSSEKKKEITKVDYEAQQIKREHAKKAEVDAAINDYFGRTDEEKRMLSKDNAQSRTERFNQLDSLYKEKQKILEAYKKMYGPLPGTWTDEKVLYGMLTVDDNLSAVEAGMYMNQKLEDKHKQ